MLGIGQYSGTHFSTHVEPDNHNARESRRVILLLSSRPLLIGFALSDCGKTYITVRLNSSSCP